MSSLIFPFENQKVLLKQVEGDSQTCYERAGHVNIKSKEKCIYCLIKLINKLLN